MYLQGFYLFIYLGLFSVFNNLFSLPEILKQVVVDTKASANNIFYILTHPLPFLLYPNHLSPRSFLIFLSVL